MSQIEMNQKDVRSHDNLHYFSCICCLEQNGPFLRIAKCDHSEFLQTIPMPDFNPPVPKVVCIKCHTILKKIKNFKMQVEESYNSLSKLGDSQKRKSNLIVSEVTHLDIFEKKHINLTTENITQTSQADESKEVSDNNNIKNIQTALNIINSNATSLQSLITCNLKSLTDSLLIVANDNLNLKPTSTYISKDHSVANLKMPIENKIHYGHYGSKNAFENQTVIDNLSENNLKSANKFENEVSMLPVQIINTLPSFASHSRAEKALSMVTSAVNVEYFGNEQTELKLGSDKIHDIHKDIKSEDILEAIKNDRTKIVSIHNKEIHNTVDATETNPSLQHIINYDEKVLPVKQKLEIVVDAVYGSAVLPADEKIELDVSESVSVDVLEENGMNNCLNEDVPPVTTRTLTYTELLEERANKLKSNDYLKWPHCCEDCIISFKYKANLYHHIKRKHEMKEEHVMCEICRQVINVDDINDHRFRHYNRLECDKCNKRFVLFDEAYRHYKSEHMQAKNKRKKNLKTYGNTKRKTNDNISEEKTSPSTTSLDNHGFPLNCAELLTRDM